MAEQQPDRVEFRVRVGKLIGDRWTPKGLSKGIVLLLHGGGQTRHSWQSAGAMIARAGWTAIAIDARGHGESDWAGDSDYSLDALVDDLIEVVAILGESPVLVGASMGGRTGLIVEGENAGTLRALVLVDISTRIEPAGAARIIEFMRSAQGGFSSLEDVAEAVRAYQPQRRRPVNLDGLRKNVRLGHDGRWYWHWDPEFMRPRANREAAKYHEDRARAAAGHVRVPTMLVRGSISDVVSDDGVDELLRLIPGACVVNVPDAGHMVAGDDNSKFLTQLTKFLEQRVEGRTPVGKRGLPNR